MSSRLRALENDGTDVDQYIIGSIAAGDPLLSAGAKIRIRDSHWLTHMSYEDRKANREQMLGVTKEDLIALADQLDHAVSEAIHS